MAVCLLLCAALLAAPSGRADEQLTEAQLTQLLFELAESAEEEDFLVLPDDYRMPAVGLDGEYRLLILGVDLDRSGLKGRSDTIMLAVLNQKRGTLKLISFMRDLYVQIPGHGHNRINAAHVYGGPELVKRTLGERFGVAVDGYLAVDFSTLISLVDGLGGIRMNVQQSELNPLNGILSYYNKQNDRPQEEGRLQQAGEQLLTGLQAMSYARIRKPDSDFGRVTRQQKVLQSIYQHMREASFATLAPLLISNLDKVGTDISLAEGVELLRDLLKVGELKMSALSIPVPRGYAGKVKNGAHFLVPNLKKNMQAIADFLDEQP